MAAYGTCRFVGVDLCLVRKQLFHLLNMIALPLCMVMQTVVLSRNSKHAWYHATFLQDMVRHVFSSPFSYLPVPFGMLKAWLPSRDNHKDSTWGKS